MNPSTVKWKGAIYPTRVKWKGAVLLFMNKIYGDCCPLKIKIERGLLYPSKVKWKETFALH